MIIAVLYVLLCLLVALIGMNRKFGFLGYFFCSLFLTPAVGVIVVLASDERPKQIKICPKCSSPIA